MEIKLSFNYIYSCLKVKVTHYFWPFLQIFYFLRLSWSYPVLDVCGVLFSLLYVKGGRSLNIEYSFCYVQDTEGHHWKMCKCFDGNTSQVLDVQFGDGQKSLKLVSAVTNCLQLTLRGTSGNGFQFVCFGCLLCSIVVNYLLCKRE